MSAGAGEPPASGPPAAGAPTRTYLDPTRQFAPGTLFAGRFRIQQTLGVGGMGIVYKARDERLAIDVALKVLRPEIAEDPGLRERFRTELLLARQVSHRNVVRIHDLGQEGDLLFLSMDFVPGRSLREILEQDRKLPSERAVAIARELAAGLAAAHAQGVVHRDLKPANILVDDAGHARITDFGVARSLAGGGGTQAGAIVGTPDYLSPEQARGDAVDGRSDLYALGIVLFEMLSGELPFPGGSWSETLAQRISGSPRDLSKFGVAAPPWLRAVLRRCLERSPARRYQTAEELLADLAHERTGTRAAALRWRQLDQRHRWVLALGALALLVGGGWLGWRQWSQRSTAQPQASAGTAAGAEADPADASALRGAARHAVAVLPLVDQTGKPELAWASAGVAEMLSAALADSPELRVVESLRLMRTLGDLGLRGGVGEDQLGRLAALLGVDRLVVGVVRASGPTVRVDLHLASGGADSAVAGGARLSAEDAAGDLFAVVRKLSGELRQRLEVDEGQPAAAPTSSPDAMAAYTAGVNALSRGDSLAAVPELERAVESDPAFTAAWVRLAGAYQTLGFTERALEAAGRGVATVGSAPGRIAFEARAQEADLRGDPEGAVEILRSLLIRYPHDTDARIALAEAAGRAGQLEDAIANLTEVVRAEPSHPRGWFLLGKHSIMAGDPRRAVDEYLVHALVLQNKLGNRQGQADVQNAQGVAYEQLGELERAAESYRAAAALRAEIGDRRGYATSLKNLALLALARGDWAAAAADLKKSQDILEEIGDRAGIAEVLNAKGMLEEERGRWDRALEEYRQALQLRRELGDQLALAQSLTNVGYAYHVLGQFDHASVYWQQALELQRAAGDRAGAVATTQSIGQLQMAQGKWQAATKAFLETLDTSRELGMKDASAVAHGYLGRIAFLEGRFRAALESYGKAVTAMRELGDPRGEAEFTLFEAETLGELGDAAAAAARLEAAAGLIGEGGSDEQAAELECLRGEAALRRGDLAAARQAFAAARLRAAQSGSAMVELRARLGAARAAAARAELEAVASAAARSGHVPLQLEAATALARLQLAAGGAGAKDAEKTARAALQLARGSGPYHGALHLWATLARAQGAQGQETAAAQTWGEAGREAARMRADLSPEQQLVFDRSPEVLELARQTPTDRP